MKQGDAIKGLVGWEHHGPPLPAIPGLEVLARGPVFSRGQPQNVEYTATMYPGPQGQLGLQRRHHLVVGRPERTTRLSAPLGPRRHAARPRPARAAHDNQPLPPVPGGMIARVTWRIAAGEHQK